MTLRQIAATAAAAVALALATLGMAVWWQGTRDGGDWVWSLAVAVIYGPSGAALVMRLPRLGVVFLAMAVSAGCALLAGEQAAAVAAGRSDLAGPLAVWFSSWTWVPAYALLLAVVPHLLPDGRPLAGVGRWRYRIGLAAVVSSTLAWLLAPYDELDEASEAAVALAATNPVGIPGMSVGLGIGLVLTVIGCVTGLASLALRWRRGEARRPLAWVLVGVSLTVVLLAAGQAVPGGSPVLMALAVIPLPAAVVAGAASSTSRLDAQLRSTQTQLALAQEEERRRLRHDLHDSLGPALAGVALQLEALPSDIEADPTRAAAVARRLTGRVLEAVEEVRRLVEGLGPDGSLGLVEALRDQVEGFDTPMLRTSLDLEPGQLADLPAAVEVVTVRVVREALANVARHAQAGRCAVTVDRTQQNLEVSVRDDGIGIPAARAVGHTVGSGVGQLSMRAVAHQIGGSVEIAGTPGGGTEVRLVLPLTAP